MNHNMYIKLECEEGVILTPSDQSQVYAFYQTHTVMERIIDYVEEELNKSIKFISDDAWETVANRIVDLKNDYHVSEDEAIQTVLDDNDYISSYATITDKE